MKEKAKKALKPGDAVCLIPRWRSKTGPQATVIVRRIPGIAGGVELAEPLAGSRGWNVHDLMPWRLKD